MNKWAEYQRSEDGSIRASKPVAPDVVLVAKAENVRVGRTGGHARVTLGINRTPLAYSVINFDRDTERTHLANSAHKALGRSLMTGEVPAQAFKAFLDNFCGGLWREHVGSIEIEDLAGDPDVEAAEQILVPYIIKGGGTILFAPPKSGKSYTALGMAVTADAGLTTPFAVAPHRVKTLYVNLERSRESMAARLAHVNVCLGLDARRPLRFINRRGSSLADVADRMRDAVRNEAIEFIVLDSLSRSGAGTLLADDVANAIMDTLNSFGVSWLAIGHTPRGDGSHVFGSQMQSAAADMEIAVVSEREETSGTLVIGLKVTSANDVAYPPVRHIALEFGESGLTTIRSAESSESAPTEGPPQRTRHLIVGYLSKVGNATGTEIASALSLSPDSVRWALRKYEDEFVRLQRHGRKVRYALRQNAH